VGVLEGNRSGTVRIPLVDRSLTVMEPSVNRSGTVPASREITPMLIWIG